jgi:calcineurin-like phosphoesterase family protein
MESPPRTEVRRNIASALEKLAPPGRRGRVLSQAGGGGLVHAVVKSGRPIAHAEHPALAADLLHQAQAALDAQPSHPISVAGFNDTDDIALSLVLSRIAEKEAARKSPPPGVMRQEIPGADKFELLDPGWWASVANRLLHKKVPFIAHSSLSDFRVDLPAETLSVAMVGDWGTGLPSSREIARQIAALQPDVTIHLGDVYYSGTKHEVEERFLPDWPAGTIATFAINSNHEMYSGGEGYFGVTLRQNPFAARQKASYFCLSTPGWQIVGLDSAYAASDFLYEKGNLADPQLEWLAAQLAEGARTNRRSIVLTHHNPIAIRGGTDQAFLDQVVRAGEAHPFEFWYFAHEHVGARYAPFGPEGRRFLPRCVGHGGVPYAAETKPAKGDGVRVEWTESELAGDAEEPRRAKNGFVLLVLDSKTRKLTETFIDEFGKRKAEGTF